MAERLAVYKTLGQRRVETIVAFGLASAVAAVLRVYTPLPAPLAPLALVSIVFAVVFLNTVRLKRSGAPLVPPGDISRHTIAELAERSAFLTIAEWVLGFTLFVPVLFALSLGGLAFARATLPLYLLMPAAGLVMGVRRVRTARAAMGPEAEGWYLVTYYLAILLGVGAGLGLAHRIALVAPYWCLPAVVGGLLIAITLMPPRPLSTAQDADAGVVAAGLWGLVWWGVPLTIFLFALLPVLKPEMLSLPALALIAAMIIVIGIGLSGGAGVGVLFWLFGRAGTATPLPPEEPSEG